MDNKIFDLLIVFFTLLTLALSGIRARTEKAEPDPFSVVQSHPRSIASLPGKEAIAAGENQGGQR